MSNTHPIAQRLRPSSLFNCIEQELFNDLVKRVRVLDLKAGDNLFHQDDPAERFFFIDEGQIKLSRVLRGWPRKSN